jgi:hypothetical protein
MGDNPCCGASPFELTSLLRGKPCVLDRNGLKSFALFSFITFPVTTLKKLVIAPTKIKLKY